MSFNQKPFLVSSSSSFSLNENSYHVYLDINNKSRLEGFYFECDQDDFWFPFFESLSIDLERVLLVDINRVVELWKRANSNTIGEQLLILPTTLLFQALDQYYGRDLGHEKISNNSSSKLICRCFGVYESQIEELAKEDNDLSLVKVASELKATVGCGSCIEDINSKIKFFKSKFSKVHSDQSRLDQEFNEDRTRVRPLGMNPSEVVLKIDSLKTSWIKEQELKGVKIEITSIKGHTLTFTFNEEKNSKYILETFNDYVNDRLGLVFRFNLA